MVFAKFCPMTFAEFLSYARQIDEKFPQATLEQKLEAYFVFFQKTSVSLPDPQLPLKEWLAELRATHGGNGTH